MTNSEFFSNIQPFNKNISIMLPLVNERSEEVYFGTDAPLRLLVLQIASYLKTNITKELDYKDEKVIKEIKRNCDLYGLALAKELNADKVDFVLAADNDDNAFCYNMIVDNNTKIKDKTKVVSYSKIYDMETIVKTSTGYQFKERKNKLLLLVVNNGLIFNHDENMIAAIMMHEIGHAFELGIFGTLKYMSDDIFNDMLEKVDSRFTVIGELFNKNYSLKASLIPFKVLFKGLINFIFSFLFFPNFLKEGIFSKLYLFFSKHFRFIKEKSVRIEDNNVSEKKADNNLIVMEYDRKQQLDEMKKTLHNLYKDYNPKDESSSDGKSFLLYHITNLLATIRAQIYMFDTNVLETLTLTSYTRKQYEKKLYLRKYENFADIFASSYGFGPELARMSRKFSEDYINSTTYVCKPLYKVPLLNLMMYYNHTMYNYRQNYNTPYGNTEHRIENMYKSLFFELKNNKDLTIQQKIDIKDQMTSIKDQYTLYQKNRRIYGFIINFIDIMISKKLKNKYNDKDIIMDILEPMESILTKEEFKEKEIKDI